MAAAAPKPHVDPDLVRRAAGSLLKFLHTRAEKPSEAPKALSLFDDAAGKSENIFLQVVLRVLPKEVRHKPIPIELPHPLLDASKGAEFCLFVKDPATEVKEKLASEPVPGFTRVIGYTQLRDKYHEFKAKRELVAEFDEFFCDDRILPMMPRLLGKTFFERKKNPIPVRLTRNVQHELQRAVRCTFIRHLGQGSSFSVRVGRTTLSPAALAENINAALEPIAEHVPKKWKAIQAIYLKSDSSVPIPLFEHLPVDLAALAIQKKEERERAAVALKLDGKLSRPKSVKDDGEEESGDESEEEDEDFEDVSIDSDSEEVMGPGAAKGGGKGKSGGGVVARVVKAPALEKLPPKAGSLPARAAGAKGEKKRKREDDDSDEDEAEAKGTGSKVVVSSAVKERKAAEAPAKAAKASESAKPSEAKKKPADAPKEKEAPKEKAAAKPTKSGKEADAAPAPAPAPVAAKAAKAAKAASAPAPAPVPVAAPAPAPVTVTVKATKAAKAAVPAPVAAVAPAVPVKDAAGTKPRRSDDAKETKATKAAKTTKATKATKATVEDDVREVVAEEKAAPAKKPAAAKAAAKAAPAAAAPAKATSKTTEAAAPAKAATVAAPAKGKGKGSK